jgi:hypothetical protein
LVDLGFGVQLLGRFRFRQPIAPVIHTWDMEQLVVSSLDTLSKVMVPALDVTRLLRFDIIGTISLTSMAN